MLRRNKPLFGNINFKDPIGLAFRMLRSKNKAAYFVLLRVFIAIIGKPLDLILGLFEKRLYKNVPHSSLPLILIIGGSRSGTTVLYQFLAHFLPVSYITNLSASFSSSPIFSQRLFQAFIPNKRNHLNLKNYYGSVAGFNGPHDGFHVWNKFLGKNRSLVDDSIHNQTISQLGRFIKAWHSIFKKPLLNKNNRNSLAIPVFEAAYDHNVIYIEIKRNPVYVIQSIILSRIEIQGDIQIGWGLGSSAHSTIEHQSKNSDYIEEICRQVFEVEKAIHEAGRKISQDRYYQVTYEELCENPKKVIQDCANLCGLGIQSDLSSIDFNKLENHNKRILPLEEFKRIEETVEKYLRKNGNYNATLANISQI